MASNISPYGKPSRTKPRRGKNGGFYIPVPGLGALLAIGIFALMGFTYTALHRHGSEAPTFRVQRRSLQTETNAASVTRPAEEPYVPIPGLRHTLAVLTTGGAGGSPPWSAAQLEAAAGAIVEPLGVTWYKGTEAAALGGFLGTERLPAVVYFPPHCVPATCGPPPVLELKTAAANEGGVATSVQEVAKWLRRTRKQAILLANDHPKTTVRFRHVPDGNNPEAGRALGDFNLRPKGRSWIETPLGADWVATPVDGPDAKQDPPPVWGRLRVKGDSHLVVRRPGECNILREANCTLPVPPHTFPDRVLRQREANTQRLLGDIKHQKAVTHRFTPVGFKKTRAPPLLFRMLTEYFETHNATNIIEEWTEDNIYVNHESSRFLLVDLPESGSFKPTLFELVRPVFEQWSGTALMPAAIYGIRIYTQGSILQDHADRPDTHVISAIINVEQDVDEPWPLEVVGHDGTISKVTMKRGDMVLYEGSTCAHGRPTPLNGKFMANVFLHMRPRDKQTPYEGKDGLQNDGRGVIREAAAGKADA